MSGSWAKATAATGGGWRSTPPGSRARRTARARAGCGPSRRTGCRPRRSRSRAPSCRRPARPVEPAGAQQLQPDRGRLMGEVGEGHDREPPPRASWSPPILVDGVRRWPRAGACAAGRRRLTGVRGTHGAPRPGGPVLPSLDDGGRPPPAPSCPGSRTPAWRPPRVGGTPARRPSARCPCRPSAPFRRPPLPPPPCPRAVVACCRRRLHPARAGWSEPVGGTARRPARAPESRSKRRAGWIALGVVGRLPSPAPASSITTDGDPWPSAWDPRAQAMVDFVEAHRGGPSSTP